jgi:hypothetical protein
MPSIKYIFLVSLLASKVLYLPQYPRELLIKLCVWRPVLPTDTRRSAVGVCTNIADQLSPDTVICRAGFIKMVGDVCLWHFFAFPTRANNPQQSWGFEGEPP